MAEGTWQGEISVLRDATTMGSENYIRHFNLARNYLLLFFTFAKTAIEQRPSELIRVGATSDCAGHGIPHPSPSRQVASWVVE